MTTKFTHWAPRFGAQIRNFVVIGNSTGRLAGSAHSNRSFSNLTENHSEIQNPNEKNYAFALKLFNFETKIGIDIVDAKDSGAGRFWSRVSGARRSAAMV